MRKAIVLIVGVLTAPMLLAIGIAALASADSAAPSPATEGDSDIPPELLPLYVTAARSCRGLSWTIVAAVAEVETNHARFAGATLQQSGDVRPPIIGLPLNGTNGTRAIADTDGGSIDGDTVWDRAVGPFQFIPSTWSVYGVDANGDGRADPHNFYDAVYAAAGYLCHHGAGTPHRLRAALLAYNHAGWYADRVLAIAAQYTHASSGDPRDYALPVDRRHLTLELIQRPHHDYPAWDLPLPTGTPVYAVHAGTVVAVTDDARCGRGVVIDGDDGAQYTYCHGSAITATEGTQVSPGSVVMLSGNTGSSIGPHLHLQIRSSAGALTCPQPLLEAWFLWQPVVRTVPSGTGCTS